MKTLVPAASLVLLVACRSSDYSVTARVEPWESDDTFLTVVEVEKTRPDGKREVVAMPRVVLPAGEEAVLTTRDGDGARTLSVIVQMPELHALERGAQVRTVVFEGDGSVSRSSARVAVPHEAAAEARLSFSFVRENVREVVQHLARRSGKRLVAPPGLAGEVTLAADDVSAETALALALEPLGFGLRCVDGTLHVQPVDVDRTIGLHFLRTDVHEAIGAISGAGKVEITVAPGVSGTVSIGVEGVSWELALRAVAEAAGARVERSGEGAAARVLVVPAKGPAQSPAKGIAKE